MKPYKHKIIMFKHTCHHCGKVFWTIAPLDHCVRCNAAKALLTITPPARMTQP